MKVFISRLLIGMTLAGCVFAGSENEMTARVPLNQDAVVAMLTQQFNNCIGREEKFYLNGIKAVSRTYNTGTRIKVVSYRYNGKIADQLAAIQVNQTATGTQVSARDYPDAFGHTFRVAESVKSWVHGDKECLAQSWGMS